MRTAMTFFLLILTTPSKSQTVSQLLQQLEMDVQQLAGLKAILNDMYKGYEIVDKGYKSISNIAQGHFSLYKAYLDGLLAVSPLVQGDPRVTNSLRSAATILTEYQSAYRVFANSGRFTSTELFTIQQSYNTLFNHTTTSIDELTMVLTPGNLSMDDAQRLTKIDKVNTEVTTQLQALRTFNQATAIQAYQRAQEANDISTIKALYGIGN